MKDVMKDIVKKVSANALYGNNICKDDPFKSPDETIDSLCAFLNRLNKKGYLSDKEMLCDLYNKSGCGVKKLSLNNEGNFYVV